MYCRNCGKELLDNSNFCPECGSKQNVVPDYKNHVPKFIKEHQKLSYAYVAWFILHLSLFIFSEKTTTYYFYPFGCELKYVFVNFPYVNFSLLEYSDSYDFSEFFFYAFFFPFALIGIWKLLVIIKNKTKIISVPFNIKKAIRYVCSVLIIISFICFLIVNIEALYCSEARYYFNVEQMGNPSSGWYLKHPGSMLYAYHLMSFLPFYITIFISVAILFLIYYIVRLRKLKLSQMTILDKLTLWTTELEIAACAGNGIALLISIPTSQSVSSIYFAFFFFVVIFWVLNYFWSNVIKRNNSITLKADLKKERTLKYSVVLYIVCGCVIFSLVSTFLFDSNKVDIPQDVNLCTKDIEKETNKNGYRLLYKGSLYTGDVYSIDNNCLWETTNGFPYKIVIKDVVPDIKAEMVSEEYKIVITLYHPNNKVALICNIPHSKQNGISMKFFNKNGLEISMDDFREVCPVVWNAYDKVYFKLLNKYENEISEIKEKTLW